MSKSTELRAILESAGLRISTCSVLGRFVHVGVSNKEDYDRALAVIQDWFKPESIIHLKAGADGRHLDGVKDHRFCAKL